jgi:hypothetical protein
MSHVLGWSRRSWPRLPQHLSAAYAAPLLLLLQMFRVVFNTVFNWKINTDLW